MTPYYDKDGITIYQGDCREVFPYLLIQADCAMCDPPYGETSLEWDRWPDGWLRVVAQASKRTASLWCFGSFRMFLERLSEFKDWRFVQDVVWEKHNGSGFHVDRFRRVHETAAHFVRDGVPWSDVWKNPQFTMDATALVVRKKAKPAQWQGATGPTIYVSEDGGPRLMRSVQHVRSMHGKALHPTEKPLGILTPLIDYACPPGGLVVVPFIGSGSDLQAARDSGRRAIGCEVNEQFCKVAVRRLQQKSLQLVV